MIASKSGKLIHMVATLSGKSGKSEKQKNDKSPEKSGENGGFWKKSHKKSGNLI